jgi:hypothetical protein
MKKTIGVLLVALLLVMVSTELFGAAGHRMTRLFPEPRPGLMAESTYVMMDTLFSPWSADRFFDLDQMRLQGASRAIISVYVTSSDADVDSATVLTRFTDDGLNHVVVDSQEVLPTTVGSAMYKDYPLDSLYTMRYMQIISRVHGDAAGTAIQTVGFGVNILFVDYNRKLIARKSVRPLITSFQE